MSRIGAASNAVRSVSNLTLRKSMSLYDKMPPAWQSIMQDVPPWSEKVFVSYYQKRVPIAKVRQYIENARDKLVDASKVHNNSIA